MPREPPCGIWISFTDFPCSSQWSPELSHFSPCAEAADAWKIVQVYKYSLSLYPYRIIKREGIVWTNHFDQCSENQGHELLDFSLRGVQRHWTWLAVVTVQAQQSLESINLQAKTPNCCRAQSLQQTALELWPNLCI